MPTSGPTEWSMEAPVKPPCVPSQRSTPPPPAGTPHRPRLAPPHPRTSFSRPTQRRKQPVSPSPMYKNGKKLRSGATLKMRIRQWTKAQSNPEPPLGINRPCRRLALPVPPTSSTTLASSSKRILYPCASPRRPLPTHRGSLHPSPPSGPRVSPEKGSSGLHSLRIRCVKESKLAAPPRTGSHLVKTAASQRAAGPIMAPQPRRTEMLRPHPKSAARPPPAAAVGSG